MSNATNETLTAATHTVRIQKDLYFAVLEYTPLEVGQPEVEVNLVAAFRDIDDAMAIIERWSRQNASVFGLQYTASFDGTTVETDLYESGTWFGKVLQTGRRKELTQLVPRPAREVRDHAANVAV